MKYAEGGTSIWGDWCLTCPDSLYLDMKAKLLASGMIPDLMNWIQGESDCDTYAHAIAHKAGFKAIMQDMKDTFNSDMKIIVSLISTATIYNATNRAAVNNGYQELLAEGFIHGIVTTNDLTLEADGQHYTYASLITLGERFATKLQEIETLTLTQDSEVIRHNGAESKVQQKNLGLYDDDDFWYSGGVRLVKSITDFASCPDYVSANYCRDRKRCEGNCYISS